MTDLYVAKVPDKTILDMLYRVEGKVRLEPFGYRSRRCGTTGSRIRSDKEEEGDDLSHKFVLIQSRRQHVQCEHESPKRAPKP